MRACNSPQGQRHDKTLPGPAGHPDNYIIWKTPNAVKNPKCSLVNGYPLCRPTFLPGMAKVGLVAPGCALAQRAGTVLPSSCTCQTSSRVVLVL